MCCIAEKRSNYSKIDRSPNVNMQCSTQYRSKDVRLNNEVEWIQVAGCSIYITSDDLVILHFA